MLRPKGSLLELEECRRRFAAKRSAYGAWLGVEALSVELKRERALAKDREDAAEACAAAERAAAEREEAARKAEVRRRHIERDAENAARAATTRGACSTCRTPVTPRRPPRIAEGTSAR